MSRPRIAITRRIFPFLVAELRARYAVTDNQQDADLDPAQLRQHLADCDGALITTVERVDEALLAACPRLRAVCNIAVGVNNIDIAACTRRGVMVTNTPDVLTESTAEHGFALMMAAARRLAESERWLRAGHWRRWTFDMFQGVDLYGRTLGILGMGRIGRAVARRAQGFAMPVIYHNRTPLGPDLEGGAQWVSFEALFERADFLLVIVPYTAQTHHLVGAAQLARMKPSAVLVNIARGGVVDDAALAEALRAGQLFAAGLDVFDGEPVVHPALLALDCVVLTPHIASATAATREAMARLAMRNLDAALAGERPPALLNPEVLPARPGASGSNG